MILSEIKNFNHTMIINSFHKSPNEKNSIQDFELTMSLEALGLFLYLFHIHWDPNVSTLKAI